ncbi:hypothetical protein JYT78_01410 [bacterium AH-315-I20]|nr:hypothetical protein [bacterium AH-315-I20]
MKLKKPLLLGLAVSLLALTSCGGTKHFEDEHAKYDPTMSKAMNIALLTGITDPERGPLKDGVPTGNSGDGGMGAAAGANMVAGGFDMLTGGGGFSGLGVMTSFLFKTYQPEWKNHVFAWMPQDMAKDEVEAVAVMCDIMDKALRKALPKDEVITKDRQCYDYRAWSDDKKTLIETDAGKSFAFQIKTPSSTLAPPSFVTKQASYFWSYMKTSTDTSPKIDLWGADVPIKKVISPSLRRDMSPYLPSWVYIYIAPDRKTGSPAYFLNQGKKLYFIKPSSREEG